MNGIELFYYITVVLVLCRRTHNGQRLCVDNAVVEDSKCRFLGYL